MKLAILLWSITGGFCYIPSGKETYLSDILMRDLVNRMGDKDFSDMSYVDLAESSLPLGSRSLSRTLAEEQMFPADYGEFNVHPSIRDQEFLEHSSLWGNQYITGGNGDRISDGKIRPQEVKSDSTLPAYCNPPNPCPVGYTAEQGCIEDFENTASYSRRYQASQDCMCDTEHMFDCPNMSPQINADDSFDGYDLDFHRFLEQTIKMNPQFSPKSGYSNNFNIKKSMKTNPFLVGDKLPVHAKKGTKVLL